DIHADARIAVDVDDQPVGAGDLRADRGRQPEPQCAYAAGREPRPRAAEIAVLRRPHLVLADAGGDDRGAVRVAVEFFEYVVGLDERTRAVIVHGVDALELSQVRRPGAEITLEPAVPPARGERAQRLGHQSHVAPLH